MNPLWNPGAKAASLRKWADHLHREARRVFLQDGTHAHILFAFRDEGPVSITPVPPGAAHERVRAAIAREVRENDLYGVIQVGEAWTYFPKDAKDHTAFQLLDGEMRVSDLGDGDRTEALHLRMESRDGDCMVCLDRIMRRGGRVRLGERRTVSGEDPQWFAGPEA